MNDKELAEKCRLTRAGVDKIVEFSDEAWEDVEEVLDLQLAKAIPIIRAEYEPLIEEARKKGYEAGYQKAIEFNEPAVRLAVKQERERIFKEVDAFVHSKGKTYTIPRIAFDEFWQALKKGGK